jgi:hypothetical protein
MSASIWRKWRAGGGKHEDINGGNLQAVAKAYQRQLAIGGENDAAATSRRQRQNMAYETY